MLDFRNRQKNIMPVTLYDDRKLLVRFPTKRMMEKLSNFKPEKQDLKASYALIAELLSNNVAGTKVTPAQLEKMGFELEDIFVFIQEYSEFIREAISRVKNSASLTTH